MTAWHAFAETLVVQVSLISLAALVLAACCVRSAAWRHSVGVIGLSLILLIPFAAPFLPQAQWWRVSPAEAEPPVSLAAEPQIDNVSPDVAPSFSPTSEEVVFETPSATINTVASAKQPLEITPPIDDRTVDNSPASVSTNQTPWLNLTLVAWAAGAMLSAAVWFLRRRRLHQLVNSLTLRTNIDADARLQAVARDVCAAMRIEKLPAIAVSNAVPMPLVLGVWRPVIVLPADLLRDGADERLREVIIHETAHVVRRDALINAAQRLAAVLWWWHPLVLWLNRTLSRSREEVCDNYVLGQGDPRHYAETLLDLAETCSRAARLAPSLGLLGPRWTLENRIQGLLNPRRNTMTRTTRFTVVTFAVLLGAVALLVGGVRAVAEKESELASLHQAEREVDITTNSDKASLPKIAAAWRARHFSTKTAQFSWKQVIDEIEPGVERVPRNAPPKVVEQSVTALILGEGLNIRHEFRLPQTPAELSGEFDVRRSAQTNAFDGTTNRQFTTANAGDPDDWPRGIVWRDTAFDELRNYHLRALLLHYRPLYPTIDLTADRLEFVTIEMLDGRECAVIITKHTESGDLMDKYWVDLSRDYVIVKHVEEHKGQPTAQLTIEYAQEREHGWRPAKWQLEFTNGGLHATAELLTHEINAQISPLTFAFDFPRGTVVFDRDAGHRYIVLPSGDKRIITAEESQNGFDYRKLISVVPDNEVQQLSIAITDDVAIIVASKNFETMTIQTIVAGLQQSGIEEFAIKAEESPKKHDDVSLTIRIDGESAELSPSKSFPADALKAIIEALSKSGVKKVSFKVAEGDDKKSAATIQKDAAPKPGEKKQVEPPPGSPTPTADRANEGQQLLIEIKGGVAIIRATKELETALIQSTIGALQEVGIEKFVMNAGEQSKSPDDDKVLLAIRIEGTAAFYSPSKQFPSNALQAVIAALSKVGVKKVTINVAERDDKKSPELQRLEELRAVGLIPRESTPQNPPVRERPDTPTGRLLDKLAEQNASNDERFHDQWCKTMMQIVELGPDAVPELIAELDATDDDMMLRCLGFMLRAMNDKRAVPALIRAIPKTLGPGGSDMGCLAEDEAILAFMQKHDLSSRDEPKSYDFGRPVREIFDALHELTGQSFGETTLYHVFLQGTERQKSLKRQLFARTAQDWAAWWEKHWNEHVQDMAYAKVDLPPIEPKTPSPLGPNQRLRTTGAHSGWVLESYSRAKRNHVFYDFDTGRNAGLPDKWRNINNVESHLDEIIAWANNEGYDMMGADYIDPESGQSYYALSPIELQTWELGEEYWKFNSNDITIEELQAKGTPAADWLLHFDAEKEAYDPSATATFLFKTREGTPGLLFVGIEVKDDSLKPGGTLPADNELRPIAFSKGRRFAWTQFEELPAAAK